MSQRVLLQQAWGPEYGNEGDYIRTYIFRLRTKLEPEPRRPRLILTQRGQGYRMPVPRETRYPGGSGGRPDLRGTDSAWMEARGAPEHGAC